MAKKSIELALSVLKSEKANLTPDDLQQLSELTEAGENVRSDVTEALDTVELTQKLELEAQYGTRVDTLKHYGFLNEEGETKEDDVKMPTYEEAMGTFKPEELEIASHFQKPTLLLVPETSFASKVKALDAHKQGVQENDTYVNPIFKESDSGSDQITGWRAVIVDGADDLKAYEGDQLDLSFDERIKARKAARNQGEKGMDRHRYALLMMEAIKNGEPIDQKLYTLLDDDPALLGSIVPLARFNPSVREVGFGGYDPGRDSVVARLRSSVGGDVLFS